MSKKTLMLGLVLFFVAANSVAISRLALADEGTVVGVVSAQKNDDGAVTQVTLKANDGTTYVVTQDENGKKLASDMNGKKVSVTGDVAEKDNQKTITVTSFKAAEEAPAE